MDYLVYRFADFHLPSPFMSYCLMLLILFLVNSLFFSCIVSFFFWKKRREIIKTNEKLDESVRFKETS